MTDTAIDMTADKQQTKRLRWGVQAEHLDAPARGRAILALANASAESSLTMIGHGKRDLVQREVKLFTA